MPSTCFDSVRTSSDSWSASSADVDLAALEADPGTLVVPQAGETLYRLRQTSG